MGAICDPPSDIAGPSGPEIRLPHAAGLARGYLRALEGFRARFRDRIARPAQPDEFRQEGRRVRRRDLRSGFRRGHNGMRMRLRTCRGLLRHSVRAFEGKRAIVLGWALRRVRRIVAAFPCACETRLRYGSDCRRTACAEFSVLRTNFRSEVFDETDDSRFGLVGPKAIMV